MCASVYTKRLCAHTHVQTHIRRCVYLGRCWCCYWLIPRDTLATQDRFLATVAAPHFTPGKIMTGLDPCSRARRECDTRNNVNVTIVVRLRLICDANRARRHALSRPARAGEESACTVTFCPRLVSLVRFPVLTRGIFIFRFSWCFFFIIFTRSRDVTNIRLLFYDLCWSLPVVTRYVFKYTNDELIDIPRFYLIRIAF